ncbi:MAG: branched-chain amino acid ABC transporter permease [Proteobacteria bacterium]|nr:branched-chain amino acid ABC transporter permease [Pseudomonadota bacterium]
MPMEALLSVLTGGLVLGSLYALMATGLAVVWTTLGIFNFAHGAFIAVGAYVAWQISSADAIGAGFVIGLVGAVVVLFVIGVIAHFLLVQPFERKPNLVLLSVVTTLAGATIFENLLIVGWGARPKQIAPMLEGDLHLGEVSISQNEAIIIVLVLFILALVGFFLRRSRTGRAMRAVAQNREAAQLMGLDVPKLFGMAFGLSAALAGLAGVFIGSIRFINPSMGADPLLKALIVVIFGGVARFTSPIYAAFIAGMVEAFAIYYVGLYWAPAVLFALMIVVLVIKPEGLFGKHERSV